MGHELINTSQHGFPGKKSCATCMTDCHDTTTTAANAGRSKIVVHMYIARAFDKVPHRRLMNKIKFYGITDPILSRFTLYLSSRNHVVRLHAFTSHRRPATNGVIQGIVLCLLLFLLYVSIVFNVVRNGVPFLSAEDIKVTYTFQPVPLRCGHLNFFKVSFRPIMTHRDRHAIQHCHRLVPMRLRGVSWDLCSKVHCTIFYFQLLLLWRAKTYVLYFKVFIKGYSCISAPQPRNPAPCFLQNTKLEDIIFTSSIGFRAKFYMHVFFIVEIIASTVASLIMVLKLRPETVHCISTYSHTRTLLVRVSGVRISFRILVLTKVIA